MRFERECYAAESAALAGERVLAKRAAGIACEYADELVKTRRECSTLSAVRYSRQAGRHVPLRYKMPNSPQRYGQRRGKPERYCMSDDC
jgi:hypothetical protein